MDTIDTHKVVVIDTGHIIDTIITFIDTNVSISNNQIDIIDKILIIFNTRLTQVNLYHYQRSTLQLNIKRLTPI